jgi:hypothetical protein
MAIECVQKPQAIIFDGDDTAWEKRLAMAIGKAYLKREAGHLRFDRVLSGINGSLKVNDIAKKGGENKEFDGLLAFYNVLIKNKLGKKPEMYAYAANHIRKHMIREVTDLLAQANPEIPKILVSLGGSTGIEAARDIFKPKYTISNRDLFDITSGRLSGLDPVVKNGDQKLNAVKAILETIDARIERCTMIGNGDDDIPLLKASGYKLISRRSSDQVLAMKGVIELRA